MKHLLASLLLIPSISLADDSKEVWINFGGISKHVHSSYQLKEINPGFGLDWSISDRTNIGLGFYQNSFDRNSNYVGFNTTLEKANNFKLGTSYGIVSGYGTTKYVYRYNPRSETITVNQIYEDKWKYFLIPTLTYTQKRISLVLGWIPKINEDTINSFVLQFKVRIQ